MSELIPSDYFKGIKVEMRRERTDRPNWERHGYNHFQYSVKISKDGVEAEFPFWGSAVDWEKGEDPESLEALRCYISDALLYSESADVDDFANQFGEGQTISETIESYNSCKDAFEKLGRMGFDQNDLPLLDIDINKRLDEE